jgi:cyclophilin family peptidyl-prolyl cis-trans isomerase
MLCLPLFGCQNGEAGSADEGEGAAAAVNPRAAAADHVDMTAPDSFTVAFQMPDARQFVVKAHRAWSPAGVDRFYTLVEKGYYENVPVYRVIPDYTVEFGLSGVPTLDQSWREKPVQDEPVVGQNTRGAVHFARAGANSRSMRLIVNLSNNSPYLDTITVGEVKGYPPIGQVIEGLDIVSGFYAGYGERVSVDTLQMRGNRYLDERFPALSRIVGARIRDRWGSPTGN